MRFRELDIFKIRNFLSNWVEIFWIFLGFFGGFFLEDFFLEDFFGRNSLFTLLKSVKLFESVRDRCFCQDFVSTEKEGGGGRKFQPLEVRVQAYRT